MSTLTEKILRDMMKKVEDDLLYGKPKRVPGVVTVSEPDHSGMTRRVSLDVSLRAFHNCQIELAEDVVKQLCSRMTADLSDMLKDSATLHQYIRSRLEAEITKQVKDAVAGRVDEVLDDILGD